MTSVSLELCPLYILTGIAFCIDTFNLSLTKRVLTLGASKLIWPLSFQSGGSSGRALPRASSVAVHRKLQLGQCYFDLR